jgi:hypothetical protein
MPFGLNIIYNFGNGGIGRQCSKWKFKSASLLVKSETRIFSQKNGKI